MKSAIHHLTDGAAPSVAAGEELTTQALGWLSRWLAAAKSRRAAARTRRELGMLSDHQLRDIGLSRDQVEAMFGSARRD